MFVYLVTNLVNKKRYVGVTSHSVERRWYHHTAAARNGSSQVLHRAIRSYGEDEWEMITIQTCSSVEHMYEREKFWIERLGTHVSLGKGYNVSWGGEASGAGWHHTEEHRVKMSGAMKGVPQRKRGPMSDEHKAKISVANTGRKLTSETRTKMSAARMGKKYGPMSEENKAKHRGKKCTLETRAKLSAANRLRALTKMRDEMTGPTGFGRVPYQPVSQE